LRGNPCTVAGIPDYSERRNLSDSAVDLRRVRIPTPTCNRYAPVVGQNQIDSDLSVVGIDDRSLSIVATTPFGVVALKEELSTESPPGSPLTES